MKKKLLFIVLIIVLLLSVVIYNIIFSAKRVDENASSESTTSDLNKNSKNNRTYIKLEYLGKSKYTTDEYTTTYNFDKDCEFTWFRECWESENSLKILDEEYGTSFSESINLSGKDFENSDFYISFGRKLDKLYYDDYKIWDYYYLAIPVFKKDYCKNTMFLYKTDKKSNLPFMENEYWTDEMQKFNIDGDVRYKEDDKILYNY